MMSRGWQASTLQPTDWGSPQNLCDGSREFSSWRSVLHLSGNVDSLIKSDISIALNIFLLLSVLWWFFEGFDDQGRGRRCYLRLGLSLLNGQFHCRPQTLAITGCFGDFITNLF